MATTQGQYNRNAPTVLWFLFENQNTGTAITGGLGELHVLVTDHNSPPATIWSSTTAGYWSDADGCYRATLPPTDCAPGQILLATGTCVDPIDHTTVLDFADIELYDGG